MLVYLLVYMKYLWDHHNHSIHWHTLYSPKGDNSLGGTCIYYAAHMQLSLYMNNFGHYETICCIYYTLCIDVSVDPFLYSSLNEIPHRQSLVYTWGTWSTPYGMKVSPSAPRAYWRLKLATYTLKKPEDCKKVMTTGSVNVKLICRFGLSTSL